MATVKEVRARPWPCAAGEGVLEEEGEGLDPWARWDPWGQWDRWAQEDLGGLVDHQAPVALASEAEEDPASDPLPQGSGAPHLLVPGDRDLAHVDPHLHMIPTGGPCHPLHLVWGGQWDLLVCNRIPLVEWT